MTTLTAPNEFDLFSRVVQPERPTLSPDAARAILSMAFDAADAARINSLGEKARLGTLNAIEQKELDAYERVGHLLGILQFRARISLRASNE